MMMASTTESSSNNNNNKDDYDDDESTISSSNNNYYKEPSDLFKRLFLPSKTPSLTLSPNSQWLVYVNEPPLPSIDLLSKQEEKLAGIRFDPTLLVPSRDRLQGWGLDLKIQNILKMPNKLEEIPLPNNSEGIRYIRFNPNPPTKNNILQQFVFTSKIKDQNKLEIYLCNLITTTTTSTTRNINNNNNEADDDDDESCSSWKWELQHIKCLDYNDYNDDDSRRSRRRRRPNFCQGRAYEFTSNGKSLIVKVVPNKKEGTIELQQQPPTKPSTPKGPTIQFVSSNAQKAPSRTYQDLLKTKYDEDKFWYYLKTELVLIDVLTLQLTEIPQSKGGKIFMKFPLSNPNTSTNTNTNNNDSSSSRLLLLVEYVTEISYSVPLRRFGKSIELWDITQSQSSHNNSTSHYYQIINIPVDDEIPLSHDACSRHPRNFTFWLGPQQLGPSSSSSSKQQQQQQQDRIVFVHAQDGGDPKNDAVVVKPTNAADDDDDGSSIVVGERDAIFVQDIVFDNSDNNDDGGKLSLSHKPMKLCGLEWRFDDINWMEFSNNIIIVDEYRWKDRKERKWKLHYYDHDNNDDDSFSPNNKFELLVFNKKQLIWERTWEDRYTSPGSELYRRCIDGYYRIREGKQQKQQQHEEGSTTTIKHNNDNSSIAIYLKGPGASPLGDRPFLDRFDLNTLQKKRLWRCKAPIEGELTTDDDDDDDPSGSEVDGKIPQDNEREDIYENFIALLDDDKTMLISRESKVLPRNYFITNLKGDGDGSSGSSSSSSNEEEPLLLRAITNFPHPQPDLLGVTKELVKYTRKDGVDLTANLFLPPNYDAATDGPRPTLFWAYPREFKNSKAAGQVKGSKHKFVSASWASPIHWAAKGWAVMDDFALPVIGEGDAQPNDTFVEQIVAGATAAVEYATTRGVCDPSRCAVGGHSYGSFMSSHLLSHTSLFAAGIGRSGAFNRTLTPMSFQSEDRSIWEAPDTYITMSPFMHVKKYSEQDRVGKLLLIHGEADENSGTHPMQSERYFAALKAFGIESRLCMLPHERHSYRSKESILHMAWEQEEWLKSLE